MLRNVAYISGFPLNLVLLAVLEDQGFIWHHWLGKIQNKKLQIIRSIINQGKNYEIGDSTSIGTALLTLNKLKLRPRYVILVKKNEDNCSLYDFSTQTPKFLPSVLVNKNSSYIHNHLHAIVWPDTWHCQIGYIGPLSLYKLGKVCLEVKLQGKTMSQCPHCAFSKIFQQIS